MTDTYLNEDPDPLFVIKRDSENQQIYLHANTRGLAEFIQLIDGSIHGEGGQTISVESKCSTPIDDDDKPYLIEKARIYRKETSETNAAGLPQLSFEWDNKNDTLEIYGDFAGLENLKRFCSWLVKRPYMDHEHLTAPEWGGDELLDHPFNPHNNAAKHVKIMKWD